MKILFVAMPFSIHTVRWINQLESLGWEIHFFPSYPYADIHPMLKEVYYHEYFHSIKTENKQLKFVPILPFEIKVKNKIVRKIIGKLYRILKFEKSRVGTLNKVIQKIKPNVIHSLESQAAGYQVSQVKAKYGLKAKWIHSTWGIDLHFFGMLEKHKSQLKLLFKNLDTFISEGQRDIEIARNIGFNKVQYIFPSVGGGFKTENIDIDKYEKTSNRNIILLKGTQDVVRRSLVALRALERCIDLLTDYEIIIYNCEESVKIAAEIFKSKHKINIQILEESSHETMLQYNQKARLSITTNLSDGLPNTFLEAMLYGAFPIQSNTSMANEWIDNGKTGFLVHPEDSDDIEIAIKKALLDNELVDNAAQINHKTIKTLLNYDDIKSKVIDMYKNEVAK